MLQAAALKTNGYEQIKDRKKPAIRSLDCAAQSCQKKDSAERETLMKIGSARSCGRRKAASSDAQLVLPSQSFRNENVRWPMSILLSSVCARGASKKVLQLLGNKLMQTFKREAKNEYELSWKRELAMRHWFLFGLALS